MDGIEPAVVPEAEPAENVLAVDPQIEEAEHQVIDEPADQFRSSFDRFGDDLQGVVLSYLRCDDQYRLMPISQSVMNNMFTHSHSIFLANGWKSPINCLEATGNLPILDKVMTRVETQQYNSLWKVYFNLEQNCLRCVANFYYKCKNLRVLKINTASRKIFATDCVGELLEFIRPKPKLQNLYFGFIINFNSVPLMDLFIRHYSIVLKEFGFCFGLDAVPQPMINRLYNFIQLTSISIVYYNHHINHLNNFWLSVISQSVPELRRLSVYRSFDSDEPPLLDVARLRVFFPKLNYYYLGSLNGGLWDHSNFMKATMIDMYKFNRLGSSIDFSDIFTTLYYSRQHQFIMYNQRNADHRLVVPNDVRNLAYYFRTANENLAANNALALLDSAPNVVHLRLRTGVYTPNLVNYCVHRAENNPQTQFCFALANTAPLTRRHNITTNENAFFLHQYMQHDNFY